MEPRDPTLRRAGHLAAGLRRLGVARDEVLPVLVCDCHRDDRLVAWVAARVVGAVPVLLETERTLESLRDELDAHRGRVLLACSEGVAAWRQTGVHLRVIGDGDGVVWWRALELQSAAARRQRRVAA